MPVGECRVWAAEKKKQEQRVSQRYEARGTTRITVYSTRRAQLHMYNTDSFSSGCGERRVMTLQLRVVPSCVFAGVYLQAQRFPADVPEQSRRGAQGVLGSFLQREDDSARVLSQSVDQVLQLPAHLRSTHTGATETTAANHHTHIHTHTDAVHDALGKLKLLRKTTTH